MILQLGGGGKCLSRSVIILVKFLCHFVTLLAAVAMCLLGLLLYT